jgi:hypothetical protein
MIQRKLQNRIFRLLEHFPAVAILVPRQIGKTTLAMSLIPGIDKEVVYLDLELPADANKLANPQVFLQNIQDRCVIIDEIQRLPDLFNSFIPIFRSCRCEVTSLSDCTLYLIERR